MRVVLPIVLMAMAAPSPAGGAPASIDTSARSGKSAPTDAAVVIGLEDYLLLPDVPYARRDARSFYDFLV